MSDSRNVDQQLSALVEKAYDIIDKYYNKELGPKLQVPKPSSEADEFRKKENAADGLRRMLKKEQNTPDEALIHLEEQLEKENISSNLDKGVVASLKGCIAEARAIVTQESLIESGMMERPLTDEEIIAQLKEEVEGYSKHLNELLNPLIYITQKDDGSKLTPEQDATATQLAEKLVAVTSLKRILDNPKDHVNVLDAFQAKFTEVRGDLEKRRDSHLNKFIAKVLNLINIITFNKLATVTGKEKTKNIGGLFARRESKSPTVEDEKPSSSPSPRKDS